MLSAVLQYTYYNKLIYHNVIVSKLYLYMKKYYNKKGEYSKEKRNIVIIIND